MTLFCFFFFYYFIIFFVFNNKEKCCAAYVHQIITLRVPVPAVGSGLVIENILEWSQTILYKEGRLLDKIRLQKQ